MNLNNQTGWKRIRWGVTANDTALAAATYDSLPTHRVKLSPRATTLKLVGLGTGDDNGTALVNIFAGHGDISNHSQPAILLSSITFTRGTMQANNDPTVRELTALTSHYYFDTITETGAGSVADLRVGNDSGNDRIGLATIRITGESWIYAEVETLTNITNFKLMGVWVNEAIPET